MHPDFLKPIEKQAGRRKQPLVVEALAALAQHLGPGAKLPTARELARALNVNGLTLTRSLEQLENRGILRCLQGSGIYVEAGAQQKRVALVFGENIFSPASSEFGSLMLRHSAKRAAEHNERVSFYIDMAAFNGAQVPANQDLVDALREKKIDGIIIVARSSEEQETWLRKQGVPVVRAVARMGSLVTKCDAVTYDYRELVRRAVERMKLSGCRSFGLFAPLAEHAEIFREELLAVGVKPEADWIYHPDNDDSFPADLHEAAGRDFAEDFLIRCSRRKKSQRYPDGLVVTDDLLAGGVLRTLGDGGVKVGSDMQVVAHRNKGSSALSEWESAVSFILFDPEEIALALFRTLEDLMNGQPSRPPTFIPPLT